MTQKKHAYLILAHNNFSILEKLLQLIDDSRNDIYLHIDKKVKEFDSDYFLSLVKRSEMHILTDRVKVYWGDVSSIHAEQQLFKAAAAKMKYRCYHLISGVDLPLQSQDYIHSFIENNPGVEFIGFSKDDQPYRVQQVSPFTRFYRGYHRKISKRAVKLNLFFQRMQTKFNYEHVGDKLGTIKKGSNWVSLTDDFVRHLIVETERTIEYYKWGMCVDEHYKQTILFNSPFRDKVFSWGEPNKATCLRQIDWQRGNPYTYTDSDYELLTKSCMIFARKFDEKTDSKIIDRVFEEILSRQKDHD